MRHKKKLLLVTHGLFPESWGGVEVYTWNLYNEFKKNERIEPFVLTRTNHSKYHPGTVFGDETDPNLFYVHTRYMDISSLHDGGGCTEGFKDFLVSLRPDVVHFQHFWHLSMDWFKVVREVLPQAKILLTLHEYVLICPSDGQMVKVKPRSIDKKRGHLCLKAFPAHCEKCFPSWPKATFLARKKYVSECLEHVDLLLAPSHFLKNIATEMLEIPPDKIIFSENGQSVFPPSARIKPQADGLTLGFLGQITPYKGLHVLLDAMAKIEGVYNIHLKIHAARNYNSGDTYFQHKIEPRLSKLKQVQCCGAYSREQLPDILAGLDLVVVPSTWWENSPLVIQEAFMAKVPVLCSNIGGMAEKVTDGVNGLHFDVNDSDDLLKKIVDVFENRGKLELFRRNIQSVKTISENILELENIYASI